MISTAFKKAFYILFISLWTMNSNGQLRMDSIFFRDEKDLVEKMHRQQDYIENLTDTLLINNERFFFRRTPLSSKKGFTLVLPRADIRIISATALNFAKMYSLTWIVRNDSLFISEIRPYYPMLMIPDGNGHIIKGGGEPVNAMNPNDTVISRFQSFTGSTFKNGFLFVDWINGEFGILKINLNPPPKKYMKWQVTKEDYIAPPMLLHVRKGVVVKIEEDRRERKN